MSTRKQKRKKHFSRSRRGKGRNRDRLRQFHSAQIESLEPRQLLAFNVTPGAEIGQLPSVVISGTQGSDRMVLESDGGRVSVTDSGDGWSLSFFAPSDTLRIDLGDGEDELTVNTIDLDADLTINGEADEDEVAFGGDVHVFGNDLSVRAETIKVDDHVVISTRSITRGLDHLTDASIGDSGDISFKARAIPSSLGDTTTGDAPIEIGLGGAAIDRAVSPTTKWSVNQSYTGVTQASTSGQGTGMIVDISIDGAGEPTATITDSGSGYRHGDTVAFQDPSGVGDALVVTLDVGAKLLSHSTGTHSAGSIDLEAENKPGFSGFAVFQLKDTDAQIDLNRATIKGGNVEITSDADSADRFDDSSGLTGSNEYSLDFLQGLSLLGGLAFSESDATVTVSGGSIEADSLTLHATSKSQSQVRTASVYLAFAYGESKPTAEVSIQDGTTITTTGDFAAATNAEGTTKIQAVQQLLFVSAIAEKYNITLAAAYSDIISHAEISADSTVNAGGTVSVTADSTKNFFVSSNASSLATGVNSLATRNVGNHVPAGTIGGSVKFLSGEDGSSTTLLHMHARRRHDLIGLVPTRPWLQQTSASCSAFCIVARNIQRGINHGVCLGEQYNAAIKGNPLLHPV